MGDRVLAIVGGETLLGGDIRDVLAQSTIEARVKLIGAQEEEAILTAEEGEPAVITTLDEENLAGARIVFLAGAPASSRQVLALASRLAAPPALVDLTYALEDQPRARLRAPLAEPEAPEIPPDALHVVAHPAAIALAIFLKRLHERHPLRRSVVQILEPASERGKAGIVELQQQTVRLLSFQSLSKDVFDAQLSFNLLARYGAEAPVPLQGVELRIDRHLATLLSAFGRIPMPSLRLVQAPVFHGYSFSIWAEFENNPGPEALAQAVATAQIEVRGAADEAPTNVGVAGQSGMTAGVIERDRNDPSAAWFWIVADNLRVTADNAVAVARSILEPEGRA